MNFKFRIFQSMQQHIHAGKIISSYIFFLSKYLSNTICPELFSHIYQQRARTTCKVKYIVKLAFLSRTRVLTIKRNNSGNNRRNLLRCVKLSGFFS